MKKILTLLLLTVFTTVSFAQDEFVLKKRIATTDKHSITLINKVNAQLDRNIQEINEYATRQKENLDTVYNMQQIQVYASALLNLKKGFTEMFLVTDTIPVIKKGDEYYLPGDTVNSISDRKKLLSEHYSELDSFEKQLKPVK